MGSVALRGEIQSKKNELGLNFTVLFCNYKELSGQSLKFNFNNNDTGTL